MKKTKPVDDKLQKEKAEKERIERLRLEHAEKLKKEHEAKLAAQKKWLDALEYPYQLDKRESNEDYFAHYWKENNNKVIER